MNSYVTEQQQIEQLKSWWKKYGNWLIFCIVAVLLVGSIIQALRHHHEKILVHASDHYEWLLNAVESNNPQMVQAQSRYILKRYPNTPYALFAALMQARLAVYNNDLSDAEDKLQYVIDRANNLSLRQVARLRLARIYLAENKLDKGLEILKTVDAPIYQAAISGVEGDIYYAKGDMKAAREAYQNAVNNMSDAAPMQPLFQMKLDDLANNDMVRLTTS